MWQVSIQLRWLFLTTDVIGWNMLSGVKVSTLISFKVPSIWFPEAMILYFPPGNAGCNRNDFLLNRGQKKKKKKSHKKPFTQDYFTARLTWSAVSMVIAHVRPARHSPLAQSMEGHGMATHYDTSTSWLRSSKWESGGWLRKSWCRLMNAARPAGGTKSSRCNFNSAQSFSPKSDWMVCKNRG